MPPPVLVKQYKYKGRNIGALWSDGVFRKKVNCVEHQLREPPAWCIDVPTFDDLEKRAVKIVFYDNVKRVIWEITPAAFRASCGTIARLYGRQYFCRLSHWDCRHKPGYVPPPEAPPPPQQGCFDLGIYTGSDLRQKKKK